MPWEASQRSCPASEYSETMKSRQASAASASTWAVAAASRAACAASPGRSSVLDGMHAQYEHSPPTNSPLDERDAQPALGQRACAVLTGRAGAKHDDVVVIAHGDLRCLFVRELTLRR